MDKHLNNHNKQAAHSPHRQLSIVYWNSLKKVRDLANTAHTDKPATHKHLNVLRNNVRTYSEKNTRETNYFLFVVGSNQQSAHILQ